MTGSFLQGRNDLSGARHCPHLRRSRRAQLKMFWGLSTKQNNILAVMPIVGAVSGLWGPVSDLPDEIWAQNLWLGLVFLLSLEHVLILYL